MILEKQLIMTLGEFNGIVLTEEAVNNSLESFYGAPIVWNKDKNNRNYNYYEVDEDVAIGLILNNNNIAVENNNIYADLFIIDEYKHLWKGKFDSWSIAHRCTNIIDKFVLMSIVVF